MLVSAEWLRAHLGAPGMRILECTTHLHPQPVGPSRIVSGLPEFERAHIPGARYVNMATDMSDPDGRYPYTLPRPAVLQARMDALGIGSDDHVVLYARAGVMSATRVWFVLHALGHRQVSILDGGFERWIAEGGPVQSGPAPSGASEGYLSSPDARRLADLEQVRAAIDDPDARLVNALSREQHRGIGGAHYGRPGCIPGSVNIPARALVSAESGCFLPRAQLEQVFDEAGVLSASRAIVYCGGGVAASVNAFVLASLGHPGWAVYDNSLLEWSTLPELPMVVLGPE